MRPWHEKAPPYDRDMNPEELRESVDDAMREDGFDPNMVQDRNDFIDTANREAIDGQQLDRQIEEYDDSIFGEFTPTMHPPPHTADEKDWFEARDPFYVDTVDARPDETVTDYQRDER